MIIQNDLQMLRECMNDTNYEIEVNLKKTKYVVIEKDVDNSQHTLIMNNRIEQVRSCLYLENNQKLRK